MNLSTQNRHLRRESQGSKVSSSINDKYDKRKSEIFNTTKGLLKASFASKPGEKQSSKAGLVMESKNTGGDENTQSNTILKPPISNSNTPKNFKKAPTINSNKDSKNENLKSSFVGSNKDAKSISDNNKASFVGSNKDGKSMTDSKNDNLKASFANSNKDAKSISENKSIVDKEKDNKSLADSKSNFDLKSAKENKSVVSKTTKENKDKDSKSISNKDDKSVSVKDDKSNSNKEKDSTSNENKSVKNPNVDKDKPTPSEKTLPKREVNQKLSKNSLKNVNAQTTFMNNNEEVVKKSNSNLLKLENIENEKTDEEGTESSRRRNMNKKTTIAYGNQNNPFALLKNDLGKKVKEEIKKPRESVIIPQSSSEKMKNLVVATNSIKEEEPINEEKAKEEIIKEEKTKEEPTKEEPKLKTPKKEASVSSKDVSVKEGKEKISSQNQQSLQLTHTKSTLSNNSIRKTTPTTHASTKNATNVNTINKQISKTPARKKKKLIKHCEDEPEKEVVEVSESEPEGENWLHKFKSDKEFYNAFCKKFYNDFKISSIKSNSFTITSNKSLTLQDKQFMVETYIENAKLDELNRLQDLINRKIGIQEEKSIVSLNYF